MKCELAIRLDPDERKDFSLTTDEINLTSGESVTDVTYTADPADITIDSGRFS